VYLEVEYTKVILGPSVGPGGTPELDVKSRMDPHDDQAVYPVTVWAFRCLRCSHEWLPRNALQQSTPPTPELLPRVCPNCKTPYWNRQRKHDSRSPEHE